MVVQEVFLLLLCFSALPLTRGLLTDDLELSFKNLNSTRPGLCLQGPKSSGCASLSCPRLAADPGDYRSPLLIGKYRLWTSCLLDDSGDCAARVDVKMTKNYAPNAELAWNIINVSFNVIPIIIFTSIFLYYYVFQLPGSRREKKELKSIFHSLGYEADGLLYKKIHDFIYEY